MWIILGIIVIGCINEKLPFPGAFHTSYKNPRRSWHKSSSMPMLLLCGLLLHIDLNICSEI